MYLSSHFNLTVTLGSLICSCFTDSKAEDQRGGVPSMPQVASGGAVCVTLQRSELPYCPWSTRCGERILHCWDFLPPHGALVTVFFRDTGGTCEGFVFKRGFRCAREMVWGLCRSLQFLEITTLGELAFIPTPPPAIHCVLIFVGFSPFSIPPPPSCMMFALYSFYEVMFSSTPQQKGITRVRVTTENPLLTEC